MKLLEIRLKNINSLRGEHHIRFDRSPLREAGLFGIVGAMGSGKSTLLDCITLALYGRVPRIGQVTRTAIEKGGSILTKHEKECFAEVKYACSKGVFTSRWSISKTRNNTFRQAEMQVLNENGELLSESLSTAADVNIAHIGLDYDQFSKSILLCQGEFAKFLQSDRHKRAELLEKITGISDFRKIGIKAFKAYSARKRRIEAAGEAMKLGAERLLTDEARAALEQELASNATVVHALQQQLDQAKGGLEQLKRVQQLLNNITKRKGEMNKSRQELEAFQLQYGVALEHYRKLFAHRGGMERYGRLRASVDEHRRKAAQLEQDINSWKGKTVTLVKELRAWVNEEVSEGDYLHHLRSFRDRILRMSGSQKDLQKQLASGYERISALLNTTGFQEERNRFRKTGSNEQLLMQLQGRQSDEKAAYRNMLAQYGFDEERLEVHRTELMEMVSDLTVLKGEVSSFRTRSQQLKQIEEKIALLNKEEAGSRTALLKSEVDRLEQEKETAEKEREQLLRAEKLDALRTTLVDGQPCPLCGSVHHPYLHEFANNLLERSDSLEQARKAWQARKQEWEQAVLADGLRRSDLDNHHKALRGLQEEIGNIRETIDAYKQKLGLDKVGNEENIASLIEAHKEKQAKLDICIRYKQLEPVMVHLARDVAEYDSLYGNLDKVVQELKLMYAGGDIERDAREREASFVAARSGLKVSTELLEASLRDRQQDEALLRTEGAVLTEALTALGYEGVDDAAGKLISEAEQKKLEDQRGKISGSMQILEGEIRALEQQLEEAWGQGAGSREQRAESGEQKAGFALRSCAAAKEGNGEQEAGVSTEGLRDEVEARLAEQQRLVEQLDAELRKRMEEKEEKSAQLLSDKELRGQLKEEQEKLRKMQDEMRPWEMLNKLIGDANGNRFNNRAQELTLQHLLILANRRMRSLHSRYTLMMPEKLEDDDLRVADGYMGGEVRTVRSLSGGETFVISLALALGLSDLASRDIRIESLFIDEGFGSLDPDTLEEAMTTLEQLQSESDKMVGIISHVESLKERIFTQIRLEKGSSGFSTIKIYPEKAGDEPES